MGKRERKFDDTNLRVLIDKIFVDELVNLKILPSDSAKRLKWEELKQIRSEDGKSKIILELEEIKTPSP